MYKSNGLTILSKVKIFKITLQFVIDPGKCDSLFPEEG